MTTFAKVRFCFVPAALVVTLGGWLIAQVAPVAPVELGAVEFARDLDAVLAKAPEKPVFLQFQEIPGCRTCVDFGQQVLSHPLLVEAIESLFVPVAIHNNASGRDAKILARYKETAWNNPVVRYVDGEGRDLIPRKAAVYTVAGTASRMIAALVAARRPVPGYLRLLALSAELGDLGKATFAMF